MKDFSREDLVLLDICLGRAEYEQDNYLLPDDDLDMKHLGKLRDRIAKMLAKEER